LRSDRERKEKEGSRKQGTGREFPFSERSAMRREEAENLMLFQL
jgi:hypothetical protein